MYTTDGSVSSIRVVVVVLDDVLVVGVLLVVEGVEGVDEGVVLLAETDADAPVKSTMNVSMRVEQPNAVSAPRVPSQ